MGRTVVRPGGLNDNPRKNDDDLVDPSHNDRHGLWPRRMNNDDDRALCPARDHALIRIERDERNHHDCSDAKRRKRKRRRKQRLRRKTGEQASGDDCDCYDWIRIS